MKTTKSTNRHPEAGRSLNILSAQLRLSILFALGKCDVKRLRHENTTVHLGDGLGCLLGGAEADESESLRTPIISHNLHNNNIVTYRRAYIISDKSQQFFKGINYSKESTKNYIQLSKRAINSQKGQFWPCVQKILARISGVTDPPQ